MMLKNAYASTVEGTSNNGWSILSEEGNPIAVLPQPCNEYTAMAAIHMGRAAEEKAYQEGVKDGRNAMLSANKQALLEKNTMVSNLKQENIRLSLQLERLLDKVE